MKQFSTRSELSAVMTVVAVLAAAAIAKVMTVVAVLAAAAIAKLGVASHLLHLAR